MPLGKARGNVLVVGRAGDGGLFRSHALRRGIPLFRAIGVRSNFVPVNLK